MGHCKIKDVKSAGGSGIIKRGNGTGTGQVNRATGVVGDTGNGSCAIQIQCARVGEIRQGMVIGPPSVLFKVPALARVVIETVPPKFSVPAAPLVRIPAPERGVPTVRVPLLV